MLLPDTQFIGSRPSSPSAKNSLAETSAIEKFLGG